MIQKPIPEKEYRAVQALSKTDLSYLAKSPLHYINRKSLFKETDAMRLGTLIHKAILEPMEFKNKFTIAPKEVFGEKVNRRVKAHRDELARIELEYDLKGITVIDEDELDTISGILMSVSKNEDLPALINMGQPEATALWEFEGYRCKGRADYYLPDYPGGAVIEIKTTNDARPSSFSRQCFNLNYTCGSWWYLNGFKAQTFIFVVIETKAPYPISIFKADESFLHHGEQQARRLVKQLRECEESGVWPGYVRGIELLQLPSWAAGVTEDE